MPPQPQSELRSEDHAERKPQAAACDYIKNIQSPMTSEQFLREQYKMLRDEVMERTREPYRTEFFGAIAVASVFAWLLLHGKDAKIPRVAWFLPPFLVVLGFLRCLHFSIRMNIIGRFLARLEARLIDRDLDDSAGNTTNAAIRGSISLVAQSLHRYSWLSSPAWSQHHGSFRGER